MQRKSSHKRNYRISEKVPTETNSHQNKEKADVEIATIQAKLLIGEAQTEHYSRMLSLLSQPEDVLFASDTHEMALPTLLELSEMATHILNLCVQAKTWMRTLPPSHQTSLIEWFDSEGVPKMYDTCVRIMNTLIG